MKLIIVPLALLLFVAYAIAQDETNVPSSSAPGGMVLLEGYVHKARRGIDTAVGTIEKRGGMKITYDIGSLAGNYAEANHKEERDVMVWTKTQRLNGLTLILTFSSGNLLEATFRETCANFTTANAVSEEAVADFILMVSTYYEKPPDLKRIPKNSRVFHQGC